MKLKIVKTDKGYVAVSDEKLKEDNWSYGVSNKIIATDTSFKLEGIAQFKLEDTIEFPQDIIQQLSYEGKSITEINGFKNGYKAAQEKGCYGEEDIVSSLFHGYKLCLDNMTEEGSEITQEQVKEFIISLNQPKKLVAIEVEPYFTDEAERLEGLMRDGEGIRPQPLVSKSEEYPDGLLTIQKYYYE